MKPICTILAGCLLLAGSGCAQRGHDDAPPPPSRACLEAPRSHVIHATYVERSQGDRLAPAFEYIRSADERITHYRQLGEAERWLRGRDGVSASFERWFFPQQRAISYTTGDLKTVGAPDRFALAGQVVPKGALERLRRRGRTSHRCLEAVRFTDLARPGEPTMELLWLEKLDLPARVTRFDAGKKYIIELSALSDGQAELDGLLERSKRLEQLDFADLGDREDDPFIAQYIHQGFSLRGAAN